MMHFYSIFKQKFSYRRNHTSFLENLKSFFTPALKNSRINNNIVNNTIDNWYSGIEVYFDQGLTQPLIIESNIFENNRFGLVISEDKHPHYCDGANCNDNYHLLDINIACNEFYYNDVGIFGSGYLEDQPNNWTYEVTSNAWWDDDYYSQSTQNDWDILWENDGNDVDYEYSDMEPHTEPNDAGLTFNDYYVNGDPNFPSSSSGDPDLDVVPNFFDDGCWSAGSLKEPQTSIDEEIQKDEGLSVYPNPFSQEINIETEDDQSIRKVSLLDMSGRTVIEEPIDKRTEATLNTTELEQGVYFLKVTTDKGDTYQTKLIRE